MIKIDSKDKEIDRVFIPKEAAKILDISLSTLKKFIYQGRLKTFKTPGGHHRIKERDLLSITGSLEPEGNGCQPLDKTVLELFEGFMSVLELRQKFCKGHARNVAMLSVEIARKLRLDKDAVDKVYLSALLHDIGKIGIEERILNNPGRLTRGEYSALQRHSVLGEEIVSRIREVKSVAGIIRQHHERVDGKGYPDGLSGGSIFIEAKIIAVAEAFHSISAPDSYKAPLPEGEAKKEIRRCSGVQFDREVVKAFLNMENKP